MYNVPAVAEDLTAGRGVHLDQHPHKGGFSAAALPHNPQGLSFVHIQTDVTAGSQYLFSRRGKLLYNMVCL